MRLGVPSVRGRGLLLTTGGRPGSTVPFVVRPQSLPLINTMGGRAGLGLRVTHSDPYALQKEERKRERERDREKQSTREREKERKTERKKERKERREREREFAHAFVRVCAYVHVHASLTSHASACGYPPGQHKSDEPMAIP